MRPLGSFSPGFCLWLLLGLYTAPETAGLLFLPPAEDWGWTLLGELRGRTVPWVQRGHGERMAPGIVFSPYLVRTFQLSQALPCYCLVDDIPVKLSGRALSPFSS